MSDVSVTPILWKATLSDFHDLFANFVRWDINVSFLNVYTNFQKDLRHLSVFQKAILECLLLTKVLLIVTLFLVFKAIIYQFTKKTTRQKVHCDSNFSFCFYDIFCYTVRTILFQVSCNLITPFFCAQPLIISHQRQLMMTAIAMRFMSRAAERVNVTLPRIESNNRISIVPVIRMRIATRRALARTPLRTVKIRTNGVCVRLFGYRLFPVAVLCVAE